MAKLPFYVFFADWENRNRLYFSARLLLLKDISSMDYLLQEGKLLLSSGLLLLDTFYQRLVGFFILFVLLCSLIMIYMQTL
mmetsp:Transcript_35282/g.34283  ORF Transcript_35282/g.34283 Transcript_35282/m.34283 type:complete len:81 (+) Transcript_35282:297-539(+)